MNEKSSFCVDDCYFTAPLFFENYTEEELKQQEKFQKSIHLLKELYFELMDLYENNSDFAF